MPRAVESVWAVHDAHHGAEEGDNPQAHEAAPAAGKGSAATSGQPLAPSAGEAPGAGSGFLCLAKAPRRSYKKAWVAGHPFPYLFKLLGM